MAKRKREAGNNPESNTTSTMSKMAKTNGYVDVKTSKSVIQIVVGSYERTLHGVTASLTASPLDGQAEVQFADTFLFNAHASAVRCLAISPLPPPELGQTQRVYLVSGGTDEKINIYSLAASPPAENDRIPSMPTLGSNKVAEDPRNRELGTLMPHSSTVTALHFPTGSKLLSASEDNTIAITRMRDLTVISNVKAPNPKAQGQPSGDTSPTGVIPAGINDFAVHPSMKLMVSVGRGEKCMRLWNLVTGSKAGVLNFDRETLQSVKESRYSSGEGRRIRWNPNGNEFAVSFERGVIAFGEDSKAKCKIVPQPPTKLHQINYLSLTQHSGQDLTLLAVSTEDGRILFYYTDQVSNPEKGDSSDPGSIPDARLCAQMGGKRAGISGRIKDFEIIQIKETVEKATGTVVVTASSDGAIRVWQLSTTDLTSTLGADKGHSGSQIGSLVGYYDTGSRITCLEAFLMQPVSEEAGLSEFDGLTEDEDSSSDSSSSEEG